MDDNFCQAFVYILTGVVTWMSKWTVTTSSTGSSSALGRHCRHKGQDPTVEYKIKIKQQCKSEVDDRWCGLNGMYFFGSS
jgi:hypothetical protein